MRKRVYKFVSTEYGLHNLAHRRLKLSTVDDLNDPFDLAAVDTTDPQVDRLLEEHIKNFRGRRGILSFSRNWDNILLWSHYGASHTGICLGFDVPEEKALAVEYRPNLLQIRGSSDVNEDLILKMLLTKHESWSYEQEVRLIVSLNDLPDADGLWWADFAIDLELKEVIAGSQCSRTDLERLRGVLDSFASPVNRSWAYMRKDAFLLVRHDFPPPWFTK